MSEFVLDASALLATLMDERGWERIDQAILAGTAMSAVNWSEVVARLTDDGSGEEAIHRRIGTLAIDIVAFDTDAAYAAGLLRRQTRSVGLSLGDRACLVLAQQLGLPVLTADRAWQRLQIGVQIELIR